MDLPASVSSVAIGANGFSAAVGYSDGAVRVFDLRTGERLSTFKGHRKAVSCLTFDENCAFVASGSRDTTAIVWDIAAQTGICRLMGHRDEVTACRLIPKQGPQPTGGHGARTGGSKRSRVSPAAVATASGASALRLLTSSKDSTLKMWDLETQSCAQTVHSHRSEVWDFAVVGAIGAFGGREGGSSEDLESGGTTKSQSGKSSRKRGRQSAGASSSSSDAPAQPVSDAITDKVTRAGLDGASAPLRLITGGADGQLRLFAIRTAEAANQRALLRTAGRAGDGISGSRTASSSGESIGAGTSSIVDAFLRGSAAGEGDIGASQPEHVHALGGLARYAPDKRVVTVTSDRAGRYVAVHGADRTVEVYVLRTPGEVRRRIQRRVKRIREKASKRAEAASAAGEEDLDDEDEDDELAAAWQDSLAADGTEAGAGSGADVSPADALRQEIDSAMQPLATDELQLVAVVRASHRVRSVRVLPSSARGVTAAKESLPRLLVSMSNNLMELHALSGDKATKASVDGSAGSREVDTARGVDEVDGDAAQAAASTELLASEKVGSLAVGGHRSDIRDVSVSGDGSMIMTCSSGLLKVWNAHTGLPLRTVSVGFALCCVFAPGDRFAIVGTKDGKLQLVELLTGDALEEHQAHDGPVWSMDVRPDGKGMCTCSSDKTVKFWDFGVLQEEGDDEADDGSDEEGSDGQMVPSSGAGAGSKDAGGQLATLTLEHSRTMKLGEGALYVRYSPTTRTDKLLVAVSLLDNTVKVFFEDTLKFFLSLYGHRLPVMSMDVSRDGTLLVTASSDKNVKIWGLDFGDCHRSMFAHEDSVMSVKFIGRTHMFCTAGKDGLLKIWDADRFRLVHECRGHYGEAWACQPSPSGTFLVTVGHDRSIRVWERSQEQVFVDMERERERDTAADQEMRERDSAADAAIVAGGSLEAPGIGAAGAPARQHLGESSSVVGSTLDRLKGADRIIEALTICSKARDEWIEYEQDLQAALNDLTAEQLASRELAVTRGDALTQLVEPPAPVPELLKLTPAMFILRCIRSLPREELEGALSVLPFAASADLVAFLRHLIGRGAAVELCCRAAMILVQEHGPQMAQTARTHRLLLGLSTTMKSRLGELQAVIGFNLASIRFLDAVMAGTQELGTVGQQEVVTVADAKLTATSIKYGKRVVKMT